MVEQTVLDASPAKAFGELISSRGAGFLAVLPMWAAFGVAIFDMRTGGSIPAAAVNAVLYGTMGYVTGAGMALKKPLLKAFGTIAALSVIGSTVGFVSGAAMDDEAVRKPVQVQPDPNSRYEIMKKANGAAYAGVPVKGRSGEVAMTGDELCRRPGGFVVTMPDNRLYQLIGTPEKPRALIDCAMQ